jgi:hypothetical protein
VRDRAREELGPHPKGAFGCVPRVGEGALQLVVGQAGAQLDLGRHARPIGELPQQLPRRSLVEGRGAERVAATGAPGSETSVRLTVRSSGASGAEACQAESQLGLVELFRTVDIGDRDHDHLKRPLHWLLPLSAGIACAVDVTYFTRPWPSRTKRESFFI